MASLAIGKALGSVENMDDEFGLEYISDNPLPPEVDCPDMRGRWVPATAISTGGTSEGDPWGKNERWEAGILRMSGAASRDAVDDEELVR